jgi:hypothetical protein
LGHQLRQRLGDGKHTVELQGVNGIFGCAIKGTHGANFIQWQGFKPAPGTASGGEG